MRLKTGKLISPELTCDGVESNHAPYESEAEINIPAGAAATDYNVSMNNRDAQVISAALGGYALPAPRRYNEDTCDSDC